MVFYISSSISLHSHYCLKGLKGTSAGKSLWFRVFNMWILFADGFIEADSTTSQWSGQRGGQFDFNPDDQREGGISFLVIHGWFSWFILDVWLDVQMSQIETSTKLKDLVLCGHFLAHRSLRAVIDMNLKCGFAKSTTWRYQRYPKAIEFLHFISHYLSILKHPKQQYFLYWFIYHVYTHLCISIQIIYVSIHMYISIDVSIHQKKSMIFHRCSPRGSIWACNWKLHRHRSRPGKTHGLHGRGGTPAIWMDV